MKREDFLTAYNESRNGADEFYMHPMVRKFVYSNGVRDCAQAGLYWLLDILATEGVQKIRKAGVSLATVILTVKNDAAKLVLSGSGDVVFWTRKIDYTDMPEGTWNFLIADEIERVTMILVSEY